MHPTPATVVDPAPGTAPVRPGVDLVDVAEVSASIARFGERYLARVFTPDELAAAGRLAPARRDAWLAGRMAAKEAVYKALAMPAGLGMAWTAIGVADGDGPNPVVRLDGAARHWAHLQGIGDVMVSVSQAGGTAMACAVAQQAPAAPGPFGHEPNPVDTPAARHDHGRPSDHDGTAPHHDRVPRRTP